MMEPPRLKARLWVQATVRQCAVAGLSAVVARRGDDESGAVLIRLDRGRDTIEVFAQVRDGEGRPAWLGATGPAPVTQAVADSYVERQCRIDSDLWVVDIEIPNGRPDFLTPVLDR
jgi:GMP synthase (glutamine-hydrolysing)